MNKFLLAILLLIIPAKANADTFIRYGLGVFHSADYGTAEVKSFSGGRVQEVYGPIVYQYELGYFGDSSGHGRNGSGFGNAGLGVQVDPGYFVLRSTWGLGLITSPDSMLGGPFQFNQDLLFGVKGNNGAIIGVDYKHMSSAGLEQPNLGRDFMLLHVELPF